RLLEDRVRDADLPDVMEQAGQTELEHMLLIETELGCHERTEPGDSLAMTVRVRILGIHGPGKGIRKDLNVAELLGLCNSRDFHHRGVDEGALADPLGLDECEVRAADEFVLRQALLMPCDARR